MPNKLTTIEFIERAKFIHSSKYNYDKTNYNTIRIPITITCPQHGDFSQKPCDHLNGYGCTRCGWDKRANSKTKTLETVIAEFKQIHGDAYDYSQVIYIHSKEKVEIICPKHGSFYQTPLNHYHARTICPLCYRDLHTRDGFITRSIKVHQNKYDYSLVPDTKLGACLKIDIKCPKHGVFTQQKRAHLAGQGCPACNTNFSRGEKQWLASLGITDLIYSYKIPEFRTVVDGYSRILNTVYEFYGDFWHGNPNVFNGSLKHPLLNGTYHDVYERTISRENKLRQYGYNVIYIWESHWKSQHISMLT